MSNEVKGKLVLQEVPSGAVEKKVVRLLLQFAKSASIEELTQKVRRTPYTLSKNIEAEKAALIIEAVEKLGAAAVFVPFSYAPAKPAVERFTAVESEPRFVMGPSAVSTQAAYGGPVRPQPANSGVRKLITALIAFLMMLSFGFLAWQLWPFVGGKIQEWVSYLKQLF
jgi:hypothetical protein